MTGKFIIDEKTARHMTEVALDIYNRSHGCNYVLVKFEKKKKTEEDSAAGWENRKKWI